MLPPADTALVAADPAIPGLGHVLDVGALLDRLTAGRSPLQPTGAVVEYVRYKPGSAVVAGLRLHTEEGPVAAFAAAWAAPSTPKLAKLRAYASDDPSGAGVLADESLLLALAPATCDRDLPGLRLVYTGRDHVRPAGCGPARPLRYKPYRRWVGLAHRRSRPAAVVKVHRPGGVARHVQAVATLQVAGLPVPEPVAWCERSGLVAYRYRPGRALDDLDGAAPPDDVLCEVGRLLARLHALPTPAAPATDPHAAMRAAVRAVRAVRPGAAALAAAVTRRTTADQAGAAWVTLHGDLSADQVLLGPDGVHLLDLDRLRPGPPEADLASWVAAEITARRASPHSDPARVLGGLLDGYTAAGGPADPARLGPHVAAALLARATEPFRRREPDWPARVDALVAAAAHQAGVAP